MDVTNENDSITSPKILCNLIYVTHVSYGLPVSVTWRNLNRDCLRMEIFTTALMILGRPFSHECHENDVDVSC